MTVGFDSGFSRSARNEPGPRDWILDLFGSFVRQFGGWIAVADLLNLLDLFDVSAASGRSALSRMKRRGELSPDDQGGRRGYRLTESADQWFRDGTARIVEGLPRSDANEWVLVSFSVPETDRSIRYQIRVRLQDLGFGQVAGGLMIAPAHVVDEATRAIDRAGFAPYVSLWRAQYTGFDEPTQLVARAWNLTEILAAYHDYLRIADDLLARPVPTDDEDAFVRYVVNVNAWRELPFLDPAIPLRYLPDGWPSRYARERFEAIAAALRPAAWRHFIRVVSEP